MDDRNHIFYKSIAFLSHPLSIFAIFLLLLNDHVLRVVFSSWIFGKLGDLAWLFLFPPLLILLLSLLFRPKSLSQGDALSRLAYGLTAFVFILANLSSEFNSMVLDVMDLLLGKPHRLVSDPTDLIALCALLGSWKLWNQLKTSLRPKWIGAFAALLVGVLTVANAGMPDYGVYCLESGEGRIYAASSYIVFESTDGGYSWSPVEDKKQLACEDSFLNSEGQGSKQLEVSTSHQQARIRYQPGGPVEVSYDGGSTWSELVSVTKLSEAERTLYTDRLYISIPLEGPLDAIFDDLHGNVIFAMSHQGVLVLDPTGGWRFEAVGDYVPFSLIRFSEKVGYLTGEIFVSLGIGLLMMQIMSLDFIRDWRQKLIVGVSCLVFIPTTLIFRPAFSASYPYTWIVGVAGYFLSAIFLVPGVLDSIIRLPKQFRAEITRMLILSFISGLLYYAFLVLWLSALIPYYMLSQLLGVASAFLVYILWRKKLKHSASALGIE